jgi:hypothetical protein
MDVVILRLDEPMRAAEAGPEREHDVQEAVAFVGVAVQVDDSPDRLAQQACDAARSSGDTSSRFQPITSTPWLSASRASTGARVPPSPVSAT